MVAIIVAILSFFDVCYAYRNPGPCPKLKNDMHSRGEKLEPELLIGEWKTIFQHKKYSKKVGCHTVKYYNNTPGLNKTQLSQIVWRIDLDNNDVIFGDDLYHTFNHPEVSTLGAVQTKEEIKDPKGKKLLAEYEAQILLPWDQVDKSKISKSKKCKLTKEDKEDYNNIRKNFNPRTRSMIKKYRNYQPYKHSWQIMDTDYGLYMIQYSCEEFQEKTNQFGQTEDEIARLKDHNENESYDEDFNFTGPTSHDLNFQIQTRTIDISYLTEKRLDNLITHLRSMVDIDDEQFEKDFDAVHHSKRCPPDPDEIFQTREIDNNWFTEFIQQQEQEEFWL